jgi:hypothetical protein
MLCAQPWNPIGIPMACCGGSLPDDEYDRYLTRVAELLQRQARVHEIVAYLAKVERDSMGLTSPSGDKVAFAEAAAARART